MTPGICACGCGTPITSTRGNYAGDTPAERNRHRARASYLRRTDRGPLTYPRGAATPGLDHFATLTTEQLAELATGAIIELARRKSA